MTTVFESVKFEMRSVDETLAVRLLTEDDAAALFRLTNNNRKMLNRFFDWTDDIRRLKHVQMHIEWATLQYIAGTAWHMGIFHQEKLVGRFSLKRLDDPTTGEFGVWLGQEAQGLGLSKKAGRLMVDLAFSQIGLERTIWRCLVDNVPSARLAEALGFTYDCRRHNGLLLRGVPHDLLCYSQTKEAYCAS